MPLVYCCIRTILHIYPRQSVPKTDCQTRRRILSHSNVTFDGQSSFSRGLSNMFSLWQRIDICSRVVFIPTMWLKKTFHSVFSFFSKFEIVRQINAFVNQICFSKDTLESERIQNRPPPCLTIGLGNWLSVVYMQNSTNTTVKQGHNSWWGSTRLVHSIRLFFRNQGNRQ
jgi:hypothetical protein